MSEELAEKVARIIDGPGLTVDRAEAAIGVTLDAARAELKGMKREGRMGSIGFERNSAINECLAALESLGGEE